MDNNNCVPDFEATWSELSFYGRANPVAGEVWHVQSCFDKARAHVKHSVATSNQKILNHMRQRRAFVIQGQGSF